MGPYFKKAGFMILSDQDTKESVAIAVKTVVKNQLAAARTIKLQNCPS